MSFRLLLAAATVLATSAPLLGCSSLSRPDAITIHAEPAPPPPAPAPPVPAAQARNAAPAPGGAPAAGG